MQSTAGIGAQPDDVAGIAGNFRLMQHDVEHGLFWRNLGDNWPMAIVTEPPRPDTPGSSAAGESAALPASLALEFCGLRFASPIVLLSGCVGFGEEYTRVEGFSNRDAGAIVLKGTTGSPRLGNAPHRLCETPEGMLNAIGLQNPGVAQVVERILPTLDFEETRF